MSESILLRLAAAANDGTPAGKVMQEMFYAQHAKGQRKYGMPMTADSPLAADPREKALEKAIDLLAYLERGKFSGYLRCDAWAIARIIALEILRDRAEAEAIARAEGVVE